jgi:hypothetical protein
MFGFLTKVLKPIMSIGQKAIPAIKSGMGALGTKIASGFRNIKQFFMGKPPPKEGLFKELYPNHPRYAKDLLTRTNTGSVVETGGSAQGFKYLPPRTYDPTSLFN